MTPQCSFGLHRASRRSNIVSGPGMSLRRDFRSAEHGALTWNAIDTGISSKALTPVFRLPPELLSAIFLLLRDVQEPDPPPDITGRKQPPVPPCVHRLGWMLMLQVCRTWREVAIGNPLLWKRVPFSLGHLWANCILSRSQNAPVSIEITRKDFSHFDNEAQEDGELVARHLSHTHALRMTASHHWLQLALSWLSKPAPMLHTLHLAISRTFHLMTPCIPAPDDLFTCHTPHLRDAVLYDVFVPWTSPLFTGLQSLYIQYSFRLPGYDYEEWAPTLTEFLDALERMPALKELCIEGPLPYYDSNIHSLTPASNARKVSLPELKHELQLGGRMLDVALSLSHLVTPERVSLGLEIIPYDEDEELEMREFFRVVSNHITPRVRDHIPVEEMYINDYRGLYLSACPEFGYSGHVYFEFARSDMDKPGVLHHFLETLPFRPIIRVEISGLEFDRNHWLEAFGDADGNASSIICISIEGGYLEEFCSFLGGPDRALPPAELELPLSDLESLEFKEYSFGTPSRRLLLELYENARSKRYNWTG